MTERDSTSSRSRDGRAPFGAAAAVVAVVLATTLLRSQDDEEFYFDRAPFLQQLTASSVVLVSQSAEPRIATLRLTVDGGELRYLEEPERGHDHVFALEGLAADIEYTYEVSHEETSWSGRVRTAPLDDRPWRFAAIGDSGHRGVNGGRIAQDDVADVLRAAAPDLLFHTGDLAYPAGHPITYQEKFFAVYADLLARVPVYPVPGNHDCQTDVRFYLDAFHLPENAPGTPELNYSFEVRNAHVVALSTCAQLSPELREWLRDDLRAASQRWKIAILHDPPYSRGPHGSTEWLKADVVPLLEEGGVDLVLSGDEHLYERTYPVRGGRVRNAFLEPEYDRPDGIVYVVTGGGGATLYRPSPHLFRPDQELFRTLISSHHAVVVDVRPDDLDVRAVDREGSVIDRFRIAKGEGPRPAFSYRVGDANENGVVNLTDAIATLNFLFGGQGEVCNAAADLDASQDLDLSDPILLLSGLFLGRILSAAPLGTCVVRSADEAIDSTGCKATCSF